jgi:hypothetical protein
MSIVQAAIALRGKDETAAAFRSVIRNAETAQKQISSKMRAAFNFLGAGAAIYGIGRAVNNAIQAGDDLAKFAEKSGLAAEAASELAHAAKMADLDLGSLATGVRFMQRTISEAGSGSKQATQLFKSLGVTLEQVGKLTPDQQFELFAEQISRLKDPADRSRAAVELFGRAGADLLPMFEDGAQGVRALRQEAKELGKSFSAEDLQKFQDADDAMKRFGASASGLADILAMKAGPAIAGFFDTLRIAMGGGTDRENLISDLEGRINFLKMSAVTEESAKELKQLQTRLELLQNPKSDPIAGRGRVFNAGELPEGFGWLKDVKEEAKLTKKELEELERFKNQPTQMSNDAASLMNSIAPPLAENDAAIARAMAEISEDGVAATSRVIELGEAYDTANDKAESFLETIKDESARQFFTAISDVIYDMGSGMDDFAKSALDAFRRILANKLTEQLFELLAGVGGGGTSGGFLGAIGGFFSSLLPKASGGPVLAGSGYMVGENGPEMFLPKVNGTIVPNQRLGGGGGAAPISVTYHNTYKIDARTDAAAIREYVDRATSESAKQTVKFLTDHSSRGRPFK